MRYRNIWVMLFMLGLVVFIGVLPNIPHVKGIQREAFVSDVADKDTWVAINYPNRNYGDDDTLETGYLFGNEREAYFHFNFSNKPNNFIRAEIALDFWYAAQELTLTVCIIEEEWEELSMTWNTKPNKGQVLGQITILGTDSDQLDITSWIAGRTNISICVYLNYYVDERALINSRESDYPQNRPQIKWIYMETAEIDVTSPTSSDNWNELDTYTIMWTSVGPIDYVIIELYKGNELMEHIFHADDNDGEYDLYLAPSLAYNESNIYRIKISDYDDSRVYGFSDYFSITPSPDSIPGYFLFPIIMILGVSVVALTKMVTIGIKAKKNKM